MKPKYLLTFTLKGLPNYQWFDNEEDLKEFIVTFKVDKDDIFEAIEVRDCRLIELK